MAQISSINFKKSNPIQTQHNDRDLPPSYLIGGGVECNLNHKEALALKNKMIKNAIEAYNKNKSAKAPSFKAKSYEWSAVVNIKPDTTMNDLENLSKHFQEKYGFQCYQIAIHRDEGHINEQGEKIINHHAHIEFITLDKETGKNNFRREKITPKALRQIQSEVAEILKMERGVDKRKSGAKRIEPRAYAVLKEKEKKGKKQEKLLNKSEYKQIIENFRKKQAGKGFTKEFFKDLSNLKKNFQEVNETSLSEFLNDILEKHQEHLKDYQDFAREKITLIWEERKREEKILREQINSLEKEKLKLEFELIKTNSNLKKRDDFINNLGRMLNFQDLNYNTPLNELERYLNQKEQKNDEIYQQDKENEFKNNLNTNTDKEQNISKYSNSKIDRITEKLRKKQMERNRFK